MNIVFAIIWKVIVLIRLRHQYVRPEREMSTNDNISYILNIFGRASDSNDVEISAQRNTHGSMDRNR